MKKVQHRAPQDYSQPLRRAFQLGFLLLNLWIGVQFYLFVRYYETHGAFLKLTRPPGVEGWLPIASLMNLKAFVLTGDIPKIHPAGMFLLIAFLSASFVFRKSFCGWFCPIGTISEYLGKLRRKHFQLPLWADLPLRSLKYILMAGFLYAVASMSVEGIRAFLESPYGVVDDVKMLNFFRNLGLAGAAVIAGLALASVFVQNFWCRYLCPYGALMGLASLASPLRIRRDKTLCIDCGKCSKACPSLLPVDQLVTIKSAECLGCMQCIAVCPEDRALIMSAPRAKRVPAWALAAGIAMLFIGAYATAQLTGHWHTDLPDAVYQNVVPRADEFEHP